jgi:hypothetical protein
MYHPTIFNAKKSLKDWIAHWIPQLARDASSPEASEMVANLAALTTFLDLQLSCLSEQATEDHIAEYEQQFSDTDEQM